jgi:hypothetical protein
MGKKILSFGVILLSFLFSIPHSGFSQEKDIEKLSIRVKLACSAQDNIRGEVESYLRRELRSLNDVILVDENPDLEVRIIAMEQKTTDGIKVGLVFSVVVLEPMADTIKFWVMSQGKIAYDKLAFMDKLKDDLRIYAYKAHWVRTGPIEELRSICQKIVARFDIDHLEEARKSHQQFIDYLKDSKDK